MSFTAPTLDYAAMLPILVVLATALVGVLVEALTRPGSRRRVQLLVTVVGLVGAFVALAVAALSQQGPGLITGEAAVEVRKSKG